MFWIYLLSQLAVVFNFQPEVGSLSERIQAARDVAKRLEESSKEERPTSQMHRVKKYARTQPTAEEAKRIAKIFSAKYSST